MRCWCLSLVGKSRNRVSMVSFALSIIEIICTILLSNLLKITQHQLILFHRKKASLRRLRIWSLISLETSGTKSSKSSLFRANFVKLFTWKDHVLHGNTILYQLPRGVLQFVNASTDSLPTLGNLRRWWLRSSKNIRCPLCQNNQTRHHLLNFCKTRLEQGQYTLRHIILPWLTF